MSKKTTNNQKNPQLVEGLIQDFDLEFDEDWAVEFLRRVYASRQNFIDDKKLAKYRSFDLGVLDPESVTKLKEFFDPKDNEIKEGGTAEYMRGGIDMCPLIHSLLSIVKKQIKENTSSITVKGSDKLSVDKKAKERLRILNKRNIVDNINYVLEISGKPPISYDTDVDKLLQDGSNDVNINTDNPNGLIDSIKSEFAQDNWDYALLSESGMLKDGVEISHEQMISHYMSHTKFDENIAEQIISDYMKVNGLCFMFYTSQINGLPEVQYVSPETIFVSPFFNKDSSDKDFWGFQFEVTWSDYMKMVGGSLTTEQNKEVYEKNKATWFSSASYPNFVENVQFPSYAFLNTIIKLGYVEVKKHVHDKFTGKYYDVVKKFYYLPLAQDKMKPQYILGLGSLQDMFRFGTNLQYADYSIIMRRDNTKASFYEVMEVEFSRMNKIYAQYINTFASFIPEGIIFAEEPLRALADEIIREIEDEGGEMDENASSRIQSKIVRRVKQSGSMIAKKRKGDNDEERLDNPTSVMENKILIDCVGLINQLMTSYNMMLMSLGINPNRLAQEPKPRTTDKSIQGASSNSAFATMEIEDAMVYSMKEFGQRVVYYDQVVISEFDKNMNPTTDRAKEMSSILGTKGINWLEVYQDMPEQRCILEVESTPTEQDKAMLLNYVMQLELAGRIPIGTVVNLQGIDNFKLQKLFVAATIKRSERINIERQQAMMEQQQAAVQQQQQVQAQSNMQTMAQQASFQERLATLENQLRTEGQIAVKKQTLENKKEEEDHKAAVETSQKQQEAFA